MEFEKHIIQNVSNYSADASDSFNTENLKIIRAGKKIIQIVFPGKI